MAGDFVTFEGIDKSGKTTQADLLACALRNAGCEVILTREPGGTILGQTLRCLLLEKKENWVVDPRAEMFLFLADRVQHVEEVIRPGLSEGKVVISDRFSDSTLAYQGYGRQMDLSQLRVLLNIAMGGLYPDLTVLVDVSSATSIKRRDHTDYMECEIDLRRVRDGYLDLCKAEPDRIIRFDGHQQIETLSQKIYKVVGRRIGL